MTFAKTGPDKFGIEHAVKPARNGATLSDNEARAKAGHYQDQQIPLKNYVKNPTK